MDLPELPLIGPYGLPNLPDERVIPIGYHEDPIQKYWDNPGSQLRDFNFDNYLFTLLSFFNKRAARFLPEYTYKAIMTQMYVALLSHCMLFRTEKVYKLLQGYNAKGPRAWVYIESVWLQEW